MTALAIRRLVKSLAATGLVLVTALHAQRPRVPPPVIDVHLHSLPIGTMSAPGDSICTETLSFPAASFAQPHAPGSFRGLLLCRASLAPATSDSELMRRTIEMLRRYNVYALTSGDPGLEARWHEAEPRRIWPTATHRDTAILRQRVTPETRALGEFALQYEGVSPTDSTYLAIFAFAAARDLPIGIHMGPGPPGIQFLATPEFRARLTSPLALETALNRWPNLRLYLMHAAWPMLDELLAMLYSYPQLYVDVAAIAWALPPAEFYRYLKAIVDAGFADRIMFGSDQIQWPDAIPVAIHRIEAAPFLTAAQKRAILYDNAARFLRLSPEEMQREREGR